MESVLGKRKAEVDLDEEFRLFQESLQQVEHEVSSSSSTDSAPTPAPAPAPAPAAPAPAPARASAPAPAPVPIATVAKPAVRATVSAAPQPYVAKPSSTLASSTYASSSSSSSSYPSSYPTPSVGPSYPTPHSVAASATSSASAFMPRSVTSAKVPTALGKEKRIMRSAGGEMWEDPTLKDWDENDYRIFCGDLGNEVSDQMLAMAFSKYPSFQKARVVRDKKTSKSKGFGFVSFKDADDYVRAMKEMNGKYVGNRPIKLKKSNWSDRNAESEKVQEKAIPIHEIKLGNKKIRKRN